MLQRAMLPAPTVPSAAPARLRTAAPARLALPLLLGAVLLTGSCRDGEEQQASDFNPLDPPADGNHGCATTNQAFTGTPDTLALDLGAFALAPSSRVAAAADDPLLFVTGADAGLLEVDVTDPGAPVTRSLLGPGTVDLLLASAGVAVPAVLSGVAVLDDASLAVIEHASNTLLLVSRVTPDTVSFLAGLPGASGGFADGLGQQARFNFTVPTTMVPTGQGALYVADSGNHAIRQITIGTFAQVMTITGTGSPGFADGPLRSALFDTPTGLSVACDGRLYVTETGAAGLGGHRLRALGIGSLDFFGGFSGTATTLAGNGDPMSIAGIGNLASLAAPSAVFSTEEGELYFVDGLTGHARRFDVSSGEADCPFELAGCDPAMGFLAGSENVGLTVASTGDLYVALGDLDQLLRVTQL